MLLKDFYLLTKGILARHPIFGSAFVGAKKIVHFEGALGIFWELKKVQSQSQKGGPLGEGSAGGRAQEN
jgi:hypothetical protein